MRTSDCQEDTLAAAIRIPRRAAIVREPDAGEAIGSGRHPFPGHVRIPDGMKFPV
jgi:hypothetical protein